MDEIKILKLIKDININLAKDILNYSITKLNININSVITLPDELQICIVKQYIEEKMYIQVACTTRAILIFSIKMPNIDMKDIEYTYNKTGKYYEIYNNILPTNKSYNTTKKAEKEGMIWLIQQLN